MPWGRVRRIAVDSQSRTVRLRERFFPERAEPDLLPELRLVQQVANRVPGQAMPMVLTRRPSLLPVFWVVIGVVVAATYDYSDQLLLGFDVRIGRSA